MLTIRLNRNSMVWRSRSYTALAEIVGEIRHHFGRKLVRADIVGIDAVPLGFGKERLKAAQCNLHSGFV